MRAVQPHVVSLISATLELVQLNRPLVPHQVQQPSNTFREAVLTQLTKGKKAAAIFSALPLKLCSKLGTRYQPHPSAYRSQNLASYTLYNVCSVAQNPIDMPHRSCRGTLAKDSILHILSIWRCSLV